MKKFIKSLLALALVFSMAGCSKNPSYDLAEDVKLTLDDVLKVTNDEQNTIYYYYLLEVQNDSKKSYDISTLHYTITDDKEEDINAIDQNEVIPFTEIPKDQSGYIAGFVGFPNNNQKNIGLYFDSEDTFFSFKNINVREASSEDVASKQVGMKQTLFENDDFSIEYDYSSITYDFVQGNTIVSNFNINYTNKTDQRIVIPYVTPYCSLNGCLTADYPKNIDWSSATNDTIKALNIESPNTKDISGTSAGYALLYLDEGQSFSCAVSFTFESAFMLYNGGVDNPVTVELTCPALGLDRSISLPKSITTGEATTGDVEGSNTIEESKKENSSKTEQADQQQEENTDEG